MIDATQNCDEYQCPYKTVHCNIYIYINTNNIQYIHTVYIYITHCLYMTF